MFFVTNCAAPGTALLGPSITGARTGSALQAGLSYGSGHVIKQAQKSIKKIKKTKTIAYKQLDQLNEKIEKSKINNVVLMNQADFFFKAVNDNFKKNN